MKLIAAVDSNWGLGCDGDLLFYIPEDLKRFRTLTSGNVIVMGRKTLESLPNGRPLPNRENIVLTRGEDFCAPGARICRSTDELWPILREPQYAQMQVFIIGGAQIYQLLLPFCEEALITHVRCCRQADCFLPQLAGLEGWTLEELSPWQDHNEFHYAFATYRNLHPLPPQG